MREGKRKREKERESKRERNHLHFFVIISNFLKPFLDLLELRGEISF